MFPLSTITIELWFLFGIISNFFWIIGDVGPNKYVQIINLGSKADLDLLHGKVKFDS